MTGKIIRFPTTNTVDKNKYEVDHHDLSFRFASVIMDHIHDEIHEQTNECIYTDDKYESLLICAGEVLCAFYLKAKNIDHPFQEIADEFFSVDNDDDEVYDEDDIDDEEE